MKQIDLGTQNPRVLDRAADMYGPFTDEILLSKALKGRRKTSRWKRNTWSAWRP